MYNIGIETFFGRIIQPTIYPILDFFDKSFGNIDADNIPENIAHRFLIESENFVENFKVDEFDEDEEERHNKFKNKNEAKQYYYYTMMHLFKKILSYNFKLKDLLEPKALQPYIVSKVYLNQLIELMEMSHPKEKEYNHISYEYIINKNDIKEDIRIIENFNTPKFKIITLPGQNLEKYLKENNLGLTISGTLFKTHETELSLFYKFLNELYTLRNKYKKEMFKHPEKSAEYTEFNRRQTTTKVIMNSTYGLLGMSTFRYSNKWLAKTITTCGRLALKTAQFYVDKYLEGKYCV